MGKNEVQIRVLGDLAIVRNGRSVPLPASKKTRALLGYLVATGQPHLRERLCELLWDGPDDPRAALRWSLSKLRPLVAEANLQADRERVAFDPAGVDVDLTMLRAAVPSASSELPLAVLRAAAERCAGELLDGLDLPDCFRFHAWCTAEREAVRSLRVQLLASLVARVAASAPDEALKWARARLAVDPLSDAAHASVVRCLGALGRTRDAIAHYDEARRLLAAELGARPIALLERARDELSQLAAPPPVADAPMAAARHDAPRSARPLVGRRRERALVATLVAAT
ncbi:MAG: hypothetical protein JWN44_6704, partial [Myxococcales bacterium]|nr:hypothetical protein [Myxococcales bacterium]